jgi:hypothetical protein
MFSNIICRPRPLSPDSTDTTAPTFVSRKRKQEDNPSSSLNSMTAWNGDHSRYTYNYNRTVNLRSSFATFRREPALRTQYVRYFEKTK